MTRKWYVYSLSVSPNDISDAPTVNQARHIDRTDFLNSAVREKKLFENALDDSVAAGLNAGTEVLMNQVRMLNILFR